MKDIASSRKNLTFSNTTLGEAIFRSRTEGRMEGGRGARRLAPSSSGCSWAAFEETAKGYGTGTGTGQDARRRGYWCVWMCPARDIFVVGGVHKSVYVCI